MNPEFLHALWLVAVPVAVYAYKELKKETERLREKSGKHSKKLARHKENLAELKGTLQEVKEGVGKLNDKLDAVIAKRRP